jgi:hypothetical protein
MYKINKKIINLIMNCQNKSSHQKKELQVLTKYKILRNQMIKIRRLYNKERSNRNKNK